MNDRHDPVRAGTSEPRRPEANRLTGASPRRPCRMDNSGWMSTDQAAAEVGMTTEWVRRQIASGRLEAVVYATGRRRTFRIRRSSWRKFLGAYSSRSGAA